MITLGEAHFYAAVLALAAGAVVVFSRKGTPLHRWIGRLYLAAMISANTSALLIYDLWGHFGPFHIAAVVSLVTVLMGAIVAWRRKPAPGWRTVHAYWMSWSYVGLLAAAVAETSTRTLDFDFGLTVAVATLLVIVAGAVVINRQLPRTLRMR
ncbi:MAG: DUF2306 domain-containing protein [Xanthomonadales bacterium]|nr:DUF2306 domain-containing protein [Xanthomonadales bacterium]